MKKIVLAISGIFCLQLGFIAYHAGDPAANSSFVAVDNAASDKSLTARVASPFDTDEIVSDVASEETGTDAVPVLSYSSDVVKISESKRVYPNRTQVIRRTKQRPLNTFVSQNYFEKMRPVSVKYRLRDGVTFKPQLEPPSVRYPVVAVAEPGSKNLEGSGKVTIKKQKKGFFAKVLPVVKKPYDWLKAIGSALK